MNNLLTEFATSASEVKRSSQGRVRSAFTQVSPPPPQRIPSLSSLPPSFYLPSPSFSYFQYISPSRPLLLSFSPSLFLFSLLLLLPSLSFPLSLLLYLLFCLPQYLTTLLFRFHSPSPSSPPLIPRIRIFFMGGGGGTA